MTYDDAVDLFCKVAKKEGRHLLYRPTDIQIPAEIRCVEKGFDDKWVRMALSGVPKVGDYLALVETFEKHGTAGLHIRKTGPQLIPIRTTPIIGFHVEWATYAVIGNLLSIEALITKVQFNYPWPKYMLVASSEENVNL